MPHRGVIKSSCELHILRTWNPKQLFLTGCFNWMMNQIFTWEMAVSPNIHLKLVVWGYQEDGKKYTNCA